MNILTGGMKVPDRIKQKGSAGVNVITGIYVGTVTNISDSLYTGRISVDIPEFAGKDDVTVLLITPFGGVTQALDASKDVVQFGDEESGQGGTPKSYGMWPQPPSIGTEVIVAYTASREEGFLLGSFISKDRNHMMGGRASAESWEGTIQPVGEKNPFDTDPINKPVDETFKDVLKEQGLHEDYSRGHSASSARRESPSRVFGISTLGGHVLTMDDGDTEGNSKGMRLRSRGGAEILIDDTNEFIFVTNHKGNAYVEIDKDGRIDVYSQKTISMHCEEEFNLHAKGNINIESDQGVNIRSTGTSGVKVEATSGDYDLYTASNFKFEAAKNGNVSVKGNYKETASRIDMNGPNADSASRILENQLVENKNVLKSASTRVPEHHPWKGASTVQETFETAKGNTA